MMSPTLILTCAVLLVLVKNNEGNSRHRRQYQPGDECETPNKTVGECVNIRRCRPLMELLKRRREPAVTEFLRQSMCGNDNGDPMACCPRADNNNNNNEVGGLPGLDECGISVLSANKIVNGKPADLGSWPWMVALGFNTPRTKLYWGCGGSLISDRYVLTAAHCVTNLRSGTKLAMIRVGDLDLADDKNDGATPIDIPVDKAIPHEDYNPTKSSADIALVKLKDRVQYTKYIKPICLPTSDTFGDLTGYSPFIVGWGATTFKGPSTTVLQEAQVRITDEETCSSAYSKFSSTIDEKVICAMSPGTDTCQGDSGGPLMLPKIRSGRINYFLVGAVSYGFRCAEPGYPGVYTRVSVYLDWVRDKMRSG